MRIECAWCKKSLGCKEPLDYDVVTHGICEECEKKVSAEMPPVIKTKEVIWIKKLEQT